MTRTDAMRRRASARLVRLENETVATIREILKTRVERCATRCKGWFLDGERLVPVRCDECASLGGYGDILYDDHIARLPEAQRAERRAVEAARRDGTLHECECM